MSEKPTQVVVGFDFTTSAAAALDHAIALARRSSKHVFHFACIIDSRSGVQTIPSDGAHDDRYAEKVQHALTERITQAFAARDVPAAVHFFVHARFGHAAKELLVLAKGIGADMIIVGSRGMTGVERVLLGSVSEALVRGAGCSVLVARPKTYADVELLSIVEVEPGHHPYVPPHRYSYEETRVIERPVDWPLY